MPSAEAAVVAPLGQHAGQHIKRRHSFKACQHVCRDQAQEDAAVGSDFGHAGFVFIADPEVTPRIDGDALGVERILIEGEQVQVEVVGHASGRLAGGQAGDDRTVGPSKRSDITNLGLEVRLQIDGDDLRSKVRHGPRLEKWAMRVSEVGGRAAIGDDIETV